MLAYRSDIDGLRAVAVGAVVLYHAGAAGFSGGFVGVDVFFVISGYLITSIILDDLRRDRFSIVNFYERRVRRIFPALFVMMAATAAAASVLLLPNDFAELGHSAIAATLFVSNIFFHHSSDYFAGPAHLKPLLHTWSLSVEEQFYLVFPMAMWAIARYGRRRWATFLLPVLAASLAVSVWGAYARPQGTFYLAPMRAWEMLAGALVAVGALPVLRTRWIAEMIGVLGLAMIALAVWLYTEAMVFPGAAALLPCLGAVCVIHAGASGQIWSVRLLSLKPMLGIGLVSYSLYLWHWPVLVLARHANGGRLGAWEAAGAVALSLVLAVLSWRFVEQPFRGRGERIKRLPLFASGAAVMMLAIAGGAAAHLSAGWASRFPDYVRPEIAGQQHLSEGTCFLRAGQPATAYAGVAHCTQKSSGGPSGDGGKVLVWGDSFAAHLMPGFKAVAGDLTVLQATASACPPVQGFHQPRRPGCKTFNEAVLEMIERERPDVVVMSGRWVLYPGRWLDTGMIQATVDRIRRTGAEVVLVGQSPSFDFDHPYDAVYLSKRDTVQVTTDVAVAAMIGRVRNVAMFDPISTLCGGGVCGLKDGSSWLYFDGGHLSVDGSRKVVDAMMPHIRAAQIERAARLSVSMAR